MYLPDHFRVADLPEMHALMRARPLATLVSAGSMGLYATHLPTVLRDDGPYGVIECHLARANPHWKDLAEGNEALMIFQGPRVTSRLTGIHRKPTMEKLCRRGTMRSCTLMVGPR